MTTSRYLPLGALAAGLLVLPWLLPNSFYLDLAIRMAINAIIVLGLNLLIGFAGQISLGHAGFLGLGAYASAVLPTHFGWPPLAAMLAGMALTGVLAALVARPIFRLKGHYLAMATLGLGIILNIVVRNEAQWTGGPDGMPVLPFEVAGLTLSRDWHWWWLVSALLLLSVWMAQNLMDSPFGRALRALHGSEVASRGVGVDVAGYKVAIFVLSAMFASLMGSITAHYVGFCHPECGGFFPLDRAGHHGGDWRHGLGVWLAAGRRVADRAAAAAGHL